MSEMPEIPKEPAPESVTMARLDDQIRWYSQKSGTNQKRFKVLKFMTISSAAAIPLLTTLPIPYGPRSAAILGVLIAVIEGVLQMNQYQAHWISYRATSEALKHEKFLYLAKAGPYRGIDAPAVLLAERVESLMAQEGSKWMTIQTERPKDSTGASKS